MNVQNKEIIYITTKNLIDFENHPFEKYSGKRLEEMINSVKQNGILTPLIVRPKNATGTAKYEILSGHNRKNAAVIVGLTEIPCIIQENISDSEAQLIVAVTNFNQRSFADMLHSERAKSIKLYHDALKKLKGQGFRSDIFDGLSGDVTSSPSDEKFSEDDIKPTSSHFGEKLSAEITGDFFGMSKNTVLRYENLNNLTSDFMKYLDECKIGFISAVNISAISAEEQEILYAYVNENHFKINTAQSEELKKISENEDLDKDKIAQILSEKKPDNERFSTFKLYRSTSNEYFKGKNNDEINETILKALERYFRKNRS